MGAKVEKILLTHGHMDHCAAADVLRKEWQVPIEGPEEGDRFWIDNLPKWCEMSGFPWLKRLSLTVGLLMVTP